MIIGFSSHQMVHRLHQGSYPPHGDELKRLGFDVLVACAEVIDPTNYTGIEVIEAAGIDGDIYDEAAECIPVWKSTATLIKQRLDSNKTVLVACQAGLNRSGFVTALTLHEIFGWSGEKCIKHIQSRRHGALFNKSFVSWLKDNVKSIND